MENDPSDPINTPYRENYNETGYNNLNIFSNLGVILYFLVLGLLATIFTLFISMNKSTKPKYSQSSNANGMIIANHKSTRSGNGRCQSLKKNLQSLFIFNYLLRFIMQTSLEIFICSLITTSNMILSSNTYSSNGSL